MFLNDDNDLTCGRVGNGAPLRGNVRERRDIVQSIIVIYISKIIRHWLYYCMCKGAKNKLEAVRKDMCTDEYICLRRS
jgi:hypothetical protein